MKNLFLLVLILDTCILSQSSAQTSADSSFVKKIFTEELTNGKCYPLLHDLTTACPHRLSGSQGANDAVMFMQQKMKDMGFDTVWLQECMVPHWVRNDIEDANIINGKEITKVNICALGGSIATDAKGLTADVIEVDGIDALKKMNAADVKGKIVFLNEAFDDALLHPFSAYGKAVNQRWGGAVAASRLGAVGVVVRGMTNLHDNNPHTGSMGYNDSIAKIPACAICTNDADQLSFLLKHAQHVKFFMHLNCETLPDVKSYNVIGELRGTEKPKEIILVGGHLDCWDKGVGAQDDGAGVVQTVEVLSLMKTLGYKPKHTIRVICFMNEENGGRGATAYATWSKTSGEKNLAALESDEGGFTPRGFGFDNPQQNDLWKLKGFQNFFAQYDCDKWSYTGGGGADVGKLEGNCQLIMGYIPDPQRYFDFHHCANDVFSAVNQRELELGAANITALIYFIDKYF